MVLFLGVLIFGDRWGGRGWPGAGVLSAWRASSLSGSIGLVSAHLVVGCEILTLKVQVEMNLRFQKLQFDTGTRLLANAPRPHVGVGQLLHDASE